LFWPSNSGNFIVNLGQNTAFLRRNGAHSSPKLCFFVNFNGFYILIINAMQKSFKKLKKYVVHKGKSSTFAPAKREGKDKIMKSV
jgi:hypothetical protein